MNRNGKSPGSSDDYWETAGRCGYSAKMYVSSSVGEHIREKYWQAALKAGLFLELKELANVLDLGCGDGTFIKRHLSLKFNKCLGVDKSSSAIERANSQLLSNKSSFVCSDISINSWDFGGGWDAIFMVGILNHVKKDAAEILARLAAVSPRVIVVEPNGLNPIRKILEFLPSYRVAGENQSFTKSELERVFEGAGYRLAYFQQIGFVPPFLPHFALGFLAAVERLIESSPLMRHWLCASNVYAFIRSEG